MAKLLSGKIFTVTAKNEDAFTVTASVNKECQPNCVILFLVTKLFSRTVLTHTCVIYWGQNIFLRRVCILLSVSVALHTFAWPHASCLLYRFLYNAMYVPKNNQIKAINYFQATNSLWTSCYTVGMYAVFIKATCSLEGGEERWTDFFKPGARGQRPCAPCFLEIALVCASVCVCVCVSVSVCPPPRPLITSGMI